MSPQTEQPLEHLLTSLRNVTHLEFSLMTMKEHDAKEELSSILQWAREQRQRRRIHPCCFHHAGFACIARVMAARGIVVLRLLVRTPAKHGWKQPLRLRAAPRKTCQRNFHRPRHVDGTRPSVPSPIFSDIIFPGTIYELPHPAGFSGHGSSANGVAFTRVVFTMQKPTCPNVGAPHSAALRLFIGSLCNIVELNVNSLHFDDGIDFTKLLDTPTLLRLRALSLAPCVKVARYTDWP
ncbi:hypothetical protein HPB51_004172 [Rhipicephalus microplus]|uniref:Uncharacterized protein n=1 Tax=Rhipicephalus microplus TaxID=6941 RepID=A0A9J6D3J2_RHIMP|nr:hypothetical protein HPB51_004172 [Rhipicephalus microplus]